MKYDYKCGTCGLIEEVDIPTYDIHTNGKHSLSIDQVKLDERINAYRECKCGGELKKKPSILGNPLFVEVAKQRFL